MPGRYSGGNEYRFGFQGQEGDDEHLGEGNSYAFKYRIHDARIGKFLSIDPLAPDYPHNSPYAFSENRVVDGIELEGLERVHFMERKVFGVTTQIQVTKDYQEDGRLVQNTTIQDNTIDEAGVITETSRSSAMSGESSRVASYLSLKTSLNPSANPVLRNLTTGNPLPSDHHTANFLIRNQFNQTFNVDRRNAARTALIPGTPNFIDPVTRGIQLSNDLIQTYPNNVAKVLIITNNTDASNNAAIDQVNTLKETFPNIDFAVAGAPALLGKGASPDAIRIIFNPTMDGRITVPSKEIDNVPIFDEDGTNFILNFENDETIPATVPQKMEETQ